MVSIDRGDMNDPGGIDVEVGGVTLNFEIDSDENGEFVIVSLEEIAVFFGTVFVKGGNDPPNAGHEPCEVSLIVFLDNSDICFPPLNPNSPDPDDRRDVSHVDACPGLVEPPNGNGDNGNGDTGGRENGGRDGDGGVGQATVVRGDRGEELPFTGANTWWLLFLGGFMLGTGALVRRTRKA